MKTYVMDTSLRSFPAGIIEFPHTPQHKELLDALMIRGNIQGLHRDEVYECFSIRSDESGKLEIIWQPGQKLVLRLIPQ